MYGVWGFQGLGFMGFRVSTVYKVYILGPVVGFRV